MGTINLPQINLAPLTSVIDSARTDYLQMQREQAQIRAGAAQVELMSQSSQILDDLKLRGQQTGDWSSFASDYQDKMHQAIETKANGMNDVWVSGQFQNSMMGEVAKNMPSVVDQARTQMYKGAEDTTTLNTENAITSGKGLDYTLTAFHATAGTPEAPAAWLLAKAACGGLGSAT